MSLPQHASAGLLSKAPWDYGIYSFYAGFTTMYAAKENSSRQVTGDPNCKN